MLPPLSPAAVPIAPSKARPSVVCVANKKYSCVDTLMLPKGSSVAFRGICSHVLQVKIVPSFFHKVLQMQD